jgi:serine/threonine protein kinase
MSAPARPEHAQEQGGAMSFLREPEAEPIPGYRLLEPLGSGGFGEVWKCEAPGGLFKAIKFVFGNLHSLDMDGARAEQEQKALNRLIKAQVRHPFILTTELVKEIDGELVIVMELADKNLHDAFVECQTSGLVGIPHHDLLRYLRDAAEALDHMNEKHNLQHLDIKPRNLFLVSDRVKVADFGLVKHLEGKSGSGLLGGVTPLYAAPETFTSKISPHSDQYSLAIVYQELLTGQRPFNGKNARMLAQQHLQEEPELRSLPEAERPVVSRALAKDPTKRFPNCMAFVRALYNSRAPVTSHSIDTGAGPKRPKTVADTMENIQLEEAPEGLEGVVWKSLPEFDVGEESGEPADHVSQLGITVAQPQTGALRPTLLLGIGSLGRRALLELRCRCLDRFGELDKVPLFRFLYVDCDPESVRAATRASENVSPTAVEGGMSSAAVGEVAFQPHEVYHLPLQPVGHYRRRQLDQLQDWLPREKLYALPRSLKTQGSRALGRLAFTDNYLRIVARLRKAIQDCSHPDAIYQSVSQTGLALRDNVPRVYIVAAASGGGSGYLVDLGYALRRLLHQLRHNQARVSLFLLCGAPDDPATPRPELANLHATLTEINHFSDASIRFSAQYGSDGPQIKDEGPPFDCTYLVPLANRTPQARQEAIAKLGSYLFHELTTPLGPRLDDLRVPVEGAVRPYHETAGLTPFRSFGTYAVWFPRGLLLRLAARSACARLLEEWSATEESRSPMPDARFPDAICPPQSSLPQPPEVEAACARALADPALAPEALRQRLEELAGPALEAQPTEVLNRLLSQLEEQSWQSGGPDDIGNWARQAVSRVREWLGPGLGATPSNSPGRETGEWRKSRLSRGLENGVTQLTEDWDKRLLAVAAQLLDNPGPRVAAAELALGRFLEFAEEQIAQGNERVKALGQRVNQAQGQLQRALDQCAAGASAFSFFGGRSRRNLRVFLDHLAAFARQCLVEDLTNGVQHFFIRLAGQLRDRLRDLSFCRQRLRHLQSVLEKSGELFDELSDAPTTALGADPSLSSSPLPSTETLWEALRQSPTTRVVLPDGEVDLERAASRFLISLNPEQWTQLDQALQDRALTPGGGLHHLLLSGRDLVQKLMGPLLDQAATCLGEHLPITDVAQVLLATSEGSAQVQDYFARAVPLVAAREGTDGQHAFLLVAASDSGKAYGDEARRLVGQMHLVRVPGQAALLFCREQGYLRLEDLQRLLAPCRRAYEEANVTPLSSPHARCDIIDWVPLDP